MTNRIKWVILAGIICLIGAIISIGIVIWSQVRSGNIGRSGQPTSVAAKPTISNSTSLLPDVINPVRGDPNCLIDETSPYLLQHAYDPVDWYPWGMKHLRMHGRKTPRSFFLLAIQPVIGVT